MSSTVATATAGTILIVDDELQNRRLLEVLLLPEGYQTVMAASGEEALAIVAQQAPDLILLDIMMPGMDGYAVARSIKADELTSNIPIIMLTAQIDREARLAGLSAGAEEFLTKPVDRAELWLRVRNLLRLKAYGDFLINHTLMLEQQVQARTATLQRFQSAMDATADSIFLIDSASQRFIEVNATACKLFGYSREEFLELAPSELTSITPEQLQCEFEAIIEENATGFHEEVLLKCNGGSQVTVEMHRHAIRSGDSMVIVGVLRDISERKLAEHRMYQLAHYDNVTGLPNRTLFYETLARMLVLTEENGMTAAIMFIDLDHFKNINDTIGHAAGDELLREFSSRLMQCVRVRDTLGRLGGDEFAVILLLPNGPQGALRVATKIRNALCAPFSLQGHEVTVTASIGITLSPDDAGDADTLLKYADTAMYQAKHAGRDTYRFFTGQMNTDMRARLKLEIALRQAIEKEEFVLYYQPKVELSSGRIVGMEALLRWERPGHGLVAPNAFIPTLEETGMIVKVGSWVVATACKQLAVWASTDIGQVQISVNVAGRQFLEGDLEADVRAGLSDNNISGEMLELELTESSLMANTNCTISKLRNMKQLGVQISIDDFGTGYSSLAYLRRFPVDKLKIDIAFIRNVISVPDDAAIVNAIIGLAHNLQMEVVAEGVETVAQLDYLKRHGCDQVQGYYFSRPLPATDIETMLREHKHLNLV
ncbi:two-component system response regulator [Halovibrio variabilis]|uniref:cyclic-guanylate-specific phosphodiesterase n=1 Tax=Halovibrio variabilis TaxID=31910 RepID=A0A511UJQ1_9GAMM|nr:EAL domain-containing protein [Halovibrio variabilis]GEN26816.1 two-component system response regulator [Halovibrio variabilis]